jgi:hypothetical protein
MDVIPIWAAGKTMLPKSHFDKHPELKKITIRNGLNWDISLDKTFEYNKSILDEIVTLTGADKVHLGMDEIYNFEILCRKNRGKAALILSNYINKFSNYFAPRGIKTIIYHDMLLNRKDLQGAEGHCAANAKNGSENAYSLLKNRKMLMIEDWSYSENKKYADFDYFASQDIKVYPSCWYRYDNITGLSAYAKGRTDTFVCTYWSKPLLERSRGWDPRGSRHLRKRFMTYKFLPAMGLAGEEAWNAGNKDLPYNFLEQTLLLFNQRRGVCLSDDQYDEINILSKASRNRSGTIAGGGLGGIDQGRSMDISSFPCGLRRFCGVPFLIASDGKSHAKSLSVKGAYTLKLPSVVTVPIKPSKYSNLLFLHTAHFDFEDKDLHKDLKTSYVIKYLDGTSSEIKLVNDENIMAWAPALTKFDSDDNTLWLAWVGMTKDNLPTAIYAYTWRNSHPEKLIASLEMRSEDGTDASVFLIAVTGIRLRDSQK